MNLYQMGLTILAVLGVTAVTLPADAAAGKRQGRTVVFLVGEREYKTKESLRRFAREQLEPSGVRCVFVNAVSDGNDDARHDFPGLAPALADADLVLVSARRRALRPDQMSALKRHLESGKPLIGIRTASHAFHTRGQHPEGYVQWESFDADVFGGNYHGHHRAGPKAGVTPEKDRTGHPILKGVGPFSSDGSLYEVRPLKTDTTVLMTGAIPDKEPEPVAWTRLYKGKGRIFCTSLGHVSDFADPNFVRLLKNAVAWGLGE